MTLPFRNPMRDESIFLKNGYIALDVKVVNSDQSRSLLYVGLSKVTMIKFRVMCSASRCKRLIRTGGL